jgi:hypothetical protein
MSDEAVLNYILRTYFSSSNYNTVPSLSTSPTEIDHFMEVQFFVPMVQQYLKANDLDMFKVPFGFYFDLSTCVNDHNNLFLISKTLNQAKKNIPLSQYATNNDIKAYWNATTGSGKTVKALVHEAIQRMLQRANTPYGALSAYCGKLWADALKNMPANLTKAKKSNGSVVRLQIIDEVFSSTRRTAAIQIADSKTVRDLFQMVQNTWPDLKKGSDSSCFSFILAVEELGRTLSSNDEMMNSTLINEYMSAENGSDQDGFDYHVYIAVETPGA